MNAARYGLMHAPKPAGHYSQACGFGDLIFVAGQLPVSPEGKALPEEDPLAKKWETLLGYRKIALKALEPFRAEKHASLDAEIVLAPSAEDREVLGQAAALLPDLFVVSKVTIGLPADGEPRAEARQAPGNRCDRCWKYTDTPETLCQRCAAVVKGKT